MDVLLENFHFLRPLMFVLLLPLFVILYKLKQQGSSLAAWEKVCDPELLSYLKVGEETNSSKRSYWLLLVAALLILTALAGPVWKQLPQPVYQEQSSLVVLLDLSRSMDAGDLKPSRLTRAKQKLTDLLQHRKEGQTALVVFAGSAFVVTPLTEDNQTILSQLQSLTTDMMPKQGGNIDIALSKALTLLSQAKVQQGQVLLLTDSERYTQNMVQRLTDAGHRLHVIGVGTKDGAPIPKLSGGFLTDSRGNIVVPQLHESQLKNLASSGFGTYHALSFDDRDIQPLLTRPLQKTWDKEESENRQTTDEWVEEGAWLLLALIILVLPVFRRGVLVVTFCLLLQTPPAEASAWTDLWQSKNQQGEKLMAEQNYEQAATTFSDPAWKAAAAYKNQDYETALKSLESIEQPKAEELYNRGNTLAQLGRMEEAIAAYDSVLKQQPGHQDASANKALLEKLKQDQQKQGQENQDKQQQDQGKESQDKQQSDKNKESQSQKNKDQQGDKQQDEQQQGEQGKEEKDKPAQQNPEQQADKEQTSKQQSGQEKEEQKQEEQKATEQAQTTDDLEQAEAKQAFEQELRRIPDDPGGLLRRKFKYQYQQQAERNSSGAEQW